MPQLGGFDINYPQAPQPNQGFLSGDPSRTVGMLEGLQRLQILGQQAPALGQIPGLQAQNLQTNIQAQRMAMQADVRQRYLTALSNSFPGNATADEVRNFSANYVKQNSVDGTIFPDVINGITAQVAGDPKGVAHGLTQAQLQTLSPAQATAPTGIGYNAQTAQPIAGTGAQFVERARGGGTAGQQPGGGIAQNAPPGTPVGAEAYQSEQLADSATYNTDIYNIKKAQALASQIDGLGPGTAERANAEAALVSLAPSIWPDAAKERISNVQQLQKFLARIVSQTAQTMGPHTNQGLSQVTTGNPNMSISDMALPQLLQSSAIVRNMQHAQIRYAAETGGPGGYANAKSKFVSNQDPEAYAFDMMTPQQIKQYQSTLKGADRTRFNTSLRYAIKSGVVTHPDPNTQSQVMSGPWPTQ